MCARNSCSKNKGNLSTTDSVNLQLAWLGLSSLPYCLFAKATTVQLCYADIDYLTDTGIISCNYSKTLNI